MTTPPHPDYRVMPFPDRLTGMLGPYYSRLDGDQPLMALPVRDLHVSLRGFCHGTIIAGLADLQSLPAGYMAGVFDRLAATVNMTVDFIAAARLGDWLEMRADLLRVTRQFLFTQAIIRTRDGTLVARSSGIYKWDPAPHPDGDVVRRAFAHDALEPAGA